MNIKRRPGLTRRQVELFAIIYGLGKARGYCSAHKSDLSRWLNISKSDIYADLKHLEEQGLIYRRPEYKSRIYLTRRPLKDFCLSAGMKHIEDDEEHMFLSIPYWMFALTNMKDKELILFADKDNAKSDDKVEGDMGNINAEREHAQKTGWVEELISNSDKSGRVKNE